MEGTWKNISKIYICLCTFMGKCIMMIYVNGATPNKMSTKESKENGNDLC